ncbi:MAG: cation:proton antiporter [Streptosporangiales bacterium]|nr:cation:proton antiporter [Streptosporangiales bacterium]
MALSTADVAHVLVALTLLVLAAHVVGHVFGVLRQPPVIGEILGGLLLGPSVLGLIDPGLEARLFPAEGPAAAVLGAIYELGLVFLMFLAGGELRAAGNPSERRTVLGVTVAGLVLPFAVGLGAAQLFDPASLSGPNGSTTTFGLVFAIAVAVTSIPVISRILLDLGLLDTTFARIVLSVAVLEDIVLYVLLAVLLGLVQASTGDAFGLWSMTGVTSVGWSAAYYVVISVVFLGLFLAGGGAFFRWMARQRVNLLERHNPTAFRIAFLFVVVLASVALGINPVFGALMAGVSVARADGAAGAASESTPGSHPWQAIRRFSLAFFVPVYFALVGVQIDVINNFPVLFFIVFTVLACAVKLVSVWIGARLSGESRESALNLAVVMNARGGPGIVLATVTLSAGIINDEFFTVLVLFSIFTSQAAGIWLDRKFRPQDGTRDDDARTAEPEPVRGT